MSLTLSACKRRLVSIDEPPPPENHEEPLRTGTRGVWSDEKSELDASEASWRICRDKVCMFPPAECAADESCSARTPGSARASEGLGAQRGERRMRSVM